MPLAPYIINTSPIISATKLRSVDLLFPIIPAASTYIRNCMLLSI
jgi:hypothetical protein